MIQSDQELIGTQERITYFEGLVAQFRVSVQPENFAAMAGGYLAEVEKMHAEVIAYLSHHLRETQPAEVVPYGAKGLAAKSIVETASAPALAEDYFQSELHSPTGWAEGQSEGLAPVAVGSISGELQNGRENNDVITMSDWKVRKRANAQVATVSPTKPESKTAAMLA
jgi:hypothetical protein